MCQGVNVGQYLEGEGTYSVRGISGSVGQTRIASGNELVVLYNGKLCKQTHQNATPKMEIFFFLIKN